MTNFPSSFALTKSMGQFPEYPARSRMAAEAAPKPTYPIEHRARRHNDDD